MRVRFLPHAQTGEITEFIPVLQMNKNNQKFLQVGLVLFAKISAWVAFPIVIALYFGKWLDSKTGNENLFFLICTGIAFVVSMIGITRETLKYIKRINNDARK